MRPASSLSREYLSGLHWFVDQSSLCGAATLPEPTCAPVLFGCPSRFYAGHDKAEPPSAVQSVAAGLSRSPWSSDRQRMIRSSCSKSDFSATFEKTVATGRSRSGMLLTVSSWYVRSRRHVCRAGDLLRLSSVGDVGERDAAAGSSSVRQWRCWQYASPRPKNEEKPKLFGPHTSEPGDLPARLSGRIGGDGRPPAKNHRRRDRCRSRHVHACLRLPAATDCG